MKAGGRLFSIVSKVNATYKPTLHHEEVSLGGGGVVCCAHRHHCMSGALLGTNIDVQSNQKMHDLYATMHIFQMALPDAFWAV